MHVRSFDHQRGAGGQQRNQLGDLLGPGRPRFPPGEGEHTHPPLRGADPFDERRTLAGRARNALGYARVGQGVGHEARPSVRPRLRDRRFVAGVPRHPQPDVQLVGGACRLDQPAAAVVRFEQVGGIGSAQAHRMPAQKYTNIAGWRRQHLLGGDGQLSKVVDALGLGLFERARRADIGEQDAQARDLAAVVQDRCDADRHVQDGPVTADQATLPGHPSALAAYELHPVPVDGLPVLGREEAPVGRPDELGGAEPGEPAGLGVGVQYRPVGVQNHHPGSARGEDPAEDLCRLAGLELGPPARPRPLVAGHPRRVVPPGARLGFQQGVEAAPGLPDPQFPARLVGIQRRYRSGDRRPGRKPLRQQLALVARREVFRSQATVPTGNGTERHPVTDEGAKESPLGPSDSLRLRSSHGPRRSRAMPPPAGPRASAVIRAHGAVR